ncbi:hypothetical protein [Virgibacillus sp. Bac330]|uniref:hypothetical protein n=1 Tax=Virgibacillus sp. Bac330 TaxID=2419841 RepID=UPI000EF50EFD|nr:hypothetical protein [Virgibacillus sp. Bac330]
MTFRARLEEIKKNANTYKLHDFITELIYDDYLWLIQQAELVQELEKRCRYLNNELFSERTIKNEFQQGIEKQGKRIKELEMALEQIKEMAGLIDRKYFEVADKALRGKQNA